MNAKTILLFILPVIPIAFLQAQKEQRIQKVEFNTVTRGAHETIWITADSIRTEKKNLSDEKKTESRRRLRYKEWADILNALHDVSLRDIASLKSPTLYRASDGAYHSTLTITTQDQQIFTHSFDNENPNQKLQPLMQAIRKVAEPQ